MVLASKSSLVKLQISISSVAMFPSYKLREPWINLDHWFTAKPPDSFCICPTQQKRWHSAGTGQICPPAQVHHAPKDFARQTQLHLFSASKGTESHYFRKTTHCFSKGPFDFCEKQQPKRKLSPVTCTFQLQSESRGHASRFSSSSFRSQQTLTCPLHNSELGTQQALNKCLCQVKTTCWGK